MASQSGNTNQIRALWERLSGLPGGKWLYSVMLARMIPYTGSIRPRVVELGPGLARVQMKDRRAVRNHLDSVHAIAQINLAEVTSGLAMHYDMPSDVRAILTGISITYQKKARGTLTAEATADLPTITERTEFEVSAVVRDAGGDIVAEAMAHWLVGPREETPSSAAVES